MAEYEYKRVGENLFIRKSTGRYYLIVKRNDIQIRKSLKTKIRSIANARLGDELAIVGISRINPSKKSVPVFSLVYQEAIEIAKSDNLQPRTIKSIESHLKIASKSFLGATKVCDIQKSHLLQYLRERSVKKTGRTANLDLHALRRFFDVALEKGWCSHNPANEIEAFSHKKRKRYIPPSEDIHMVLKFLRAPVLNPTITRDRNKAADFVEFLALSGTRLEGAQTIKWEDVKFDQDYFKVTEKGDKTREVNLFPQLREFLMARKKDSGPIFPGEGEKRYSPKRTLTYACKHCKEGGVTRFTFHCLRHYFATECLEQGIQPSVIAGWFGHSDNGVLIMKTYADHIRRKHFEGEAAKVQITLTPPESKPAA